MADFIDVVFDGPPNHVSGRFVEVEDAQGRSINVGQWMERADGLWALRIPVSLDARIEQERRRALEAAAQAVEPTNDKPCGCIEHLDGKWWCHRCDCGNGGDSDDAQSWCTSKNEAARIRSLIAGDAA